MSYFSTNFVISGIKCLFKIKKYARKKDYRFSETWTGSIFWLKQKCLVNYKKCFILIWVTLHTRISFASGKKVIMPVHCLKLLRSYSKIIKQLDIINHLLSTLQKFVNSSFYWNRMPSKGCCRWEFRGLQFKRKWI